MSSCLRCGAPIGDADLVCPECGVQLTPSDTIFPRQKNPRSKSPPVASKPPHRADPAPGDPDPGPPPVGRGSAPIGPPPPAGGFRGKLIRILGGQTGGTPAAAPAPAPYPPAYQAAPAEAPAAYPPAYHAAPAAAAVPRWPEPPAIDPGAAPTGPSPAQPPEWRPEPRRPEAFSPPPVDDDDDDRTIVNVGVDLSRLRIPDHTHVLEIFDAHGQWRNWGPIPVHGLNVGRSPNSVDFPVLSSLAARHMRFRYDGSTLMVDDLGSLNGVALKLTEPVELTDGQRFRVGNQVLEFHEADAIEADPPLHSDDGEEFCSEDVEALGFLDLIRPSNRPGLRFPLTKHDVTVIGRKGEKVAIALSSKDFSISSRHAQIRHVGSKLYLEDLQSRNGTFVLVRGSSVVRSGDILLAGRVLFRISDHKGI